MEKSDRAYKIVNFYCGAAGEQRMDEIGESEKRRLSFLITEKAMEAAGEKRGFLEAGSRS